MSIQAKKSNKVELDEFIKAIAAFEIALNAEKTDLHRDATIQRFEFCVELAWKSSKKILGLASNSPKTIIRELAQEGMITSPTMWIEFVDLRNLTSHTYKKELAEEVYTKCRPFLSEAKLLLSKLQNH